MTWNSRRYHLYRVDSICYCNVGDEGDNDNTAKAVISNINVDNVKTEGTGTISSIVRACDTDVSHYSKLIICN